MGFMKSLKSKKKQNTVRVSLRGGKKTLYTAAKTVKLDKKSKLDGEQVFSFTDRRMRDSEEDDATIRTDMNMSSEGSSSIDLSDIGFGEILQVGSADSYFSELSAISLDGREERHSHSEEEDDHNHDVDIGIRDTLETPNKSSLTKEHNQEKPPISPGSISTHSHSPSSVISTDPSLSSVKSNGTPPKALKLKEMRRSISNDSKNYIHVFHNQLTTLEEQPSKEDDYDSDSDEFSSDNDCIYGIGQSHSFVDMASYDEHELRKRWNHSLHVMAKRGLCVRARARQEQQNLEVSCGYFYDRDTPIRDGEGEI